MLRFLTVFIVSLIWFSNLGFAQSDKYIPFDYKLNEDIPAISLEDKAPQIGSLKPNTKPATKTSNIPFPLPKPRTEKSVQEPEPKVAAVPVEAVSVEPMFWRVVMPDSNPELSERSLREIKEHILPALQGTGNAPIKIQSFASKSTQNSGDRRTALARLLEIREIFINAGVSPARMEIQALGSDTNIKPYDRIDIYVLAN